MNVSDSRIWKASFTFGWLVCMTCGCSASRTNMADRATSIERASVDQFDDEASNIRTASSDNDSNSQDSATQAPSTGRKKLTAWQEQRAEDGQSIPLARTDKTDQSDATPTEDEQPQATTSTNASNSKTPFEQAVASGRRTKPRTSKAASSETTGLGLKDANPFED